ncbi:MAG: hypothetical protein LBI17_00785 [Rickettsiales bacterium]|nr:hypothetical protein [Rickettsiales bacterium]
MTRRLELKHAKLYGDIKPNGKICMQPQYHAVLRLLRKAELKLADMAACHKGNEEEKSGL